MKRTLLFLSIILVVVFSFSLSASAHSSSQAGILESDYHTELADYYIGGELIGWSIDETLHSESTRIYYKFSNVPDEVVDCVYEAASLWSDVATINESLIILNGGMITTIYDPTSAAAATFIPITFNESTGHLISWEIRINLAYGYSAKVIAHELGHVIGLNDLYLSINQNKLMYGYTNTTATEPTSLDIWGAKVILGLHTTHDFEDYRHWGTDASGRVCHVKYCKDCNANHITHSPCNYGTGIIKGECLICGCLPPL